MKKTSNTVLKSVVVIVCMVAALVGLFYAMRYTQTKQFQASLDLLFNPYSQKNWNWCPEQTESLQWSDGGEITDAATMVRICRVELGAVEEVPQDSEWSPIITAQSQVGHRVLEASASLELFRIDGLPFKSQVLTELLKNLKSKTPQK